MKFLVELIIGMPLLGFFIQAFLGGEAKKIFGEKKAKNVMGFFAVAVIAASFIGTILLTQMIVALPVASRSNMVSVGDWISIASIHIPFEFLVDPLSITMCLIITGIGCLIHLYATGYMKDDHEFTRFFTYMNLFIVAMLTLVLAGNIVLMFVGWEGVGLCSYLLIGFWYTDQNNAKAANKAFIVNRVGDFGFMLGTFLLFALIASQASSQNIEPRFLSYDVLAKILPAIFQSHPGFAATIGLLFFVGACGKSAQFPLYFWLPDAMAGPTPVSALIHAATMVTSGIFLLNRLHFIYEVAPFAGAVITMIGAFTALFAALVAFSQTDIKKVLAYSTVSQLGFMFVACGAGGFSVGIFHVATHAFFKALLFLGAGAVIHAMAHDQDMRNYGKLAKYLPITMTTMFIGFLAISGIPPFAGFYSKEEILSNSIGGNFAITNGVNFGQIAGYVALFTAFLTAIYMARLTWLTFFGKEERWRKIAADSESHHPSFELAAPSGTPIPGSNLHWYFDEPQIPTHEEESSHALNSEHTPREVSITMWFPLVVLAILSVVGGYLLKQLDLQSWLYPKGMAAVAPATEVSWLMPAGIAAGVAGCLVGIAIYFKGLPAREGWDLSKWSKLRVLSFNQFGYDHMIAEGSSDGGKEIALALNNTVDDQLVEGGMGGFGNFIKFIGKGVRAAQTGFARSYALLMLAGAFAILVTILYSLRTAGRGF